MNKQAWEDVRTKISEFANRAYPQEACGFVYAQPDGDLMATVVLNVDEAPWYRYRISEQDARAALSSGNCIGVWHSHPADPAVPSSGDQAMAVDGLYTIIYAVQDEDLGVFLRDEHGRLEPQFMIMAS